MRAVKIILAVAVLAGITFFVIQSLQTTDEPAPPTLPQQNQFVLHIQQKIDSLKYLPDSKFSKDVYHEINYYIEDNHKNGYLGNNSTDNNQQEKNLTANLYAVYADKFIKEAFYVFNNSEWKTSDLNFIRKEYKILKGSDLLEQGSSIDQKFYEIASILAKHDEISLFISKSKSYSYNNYGLTSSFPVTETKNFSAKARGYLERGLDNQYVNNCTRLHSELERIPDSMYNKHVVYLRKKLNQWSGRYSDWPNLNLYTSKIYYPLKNEIDEFYENYNNVGEYNLLKSNLNFEYSRANEYFY